MNRSPRNPNSQAPPPTIQPPLHPPPIMFPSCPWSPVYPDYQDPTLYSPTHKSYIQIRRVWMQNFFQEMNTISYLINYTPFKTVSMDTEFPGVLYTSSDISHRHPAAQYSLMKSNVDALNLIQVGLTLSNSAGQLATLGPHHPIVVWEFAISDFDIHTHPHNQASINMLTTRCLDFQFHRTHGIHSYDLAQAMLDINLLAGGSNDIHWVTFHGAYDFGYFIKALTMNKLPNTLNEFLAVVEGYFGKNVYDVKHMMRYDSRLYGGLEDVAARIGVSRVLGLGHQAGSDSLLTQMVFHKIIKEYLTDQEMFNQKIPGRIFPLTI
ncbi:unnamed protein product [Rhodiola kirilowii]